MVKKYQWLLDPFRFLIVVRANQLINVKMNQYGSIIMTRHLSVHLLNFVSSSKSTIQWLGSGLHRGALPSSCGRRVSSNTRSSGWVIRCHLPATSQRASSPFSAKCFHSSRVITSTLVYPGTRLFNCKLDMETRPTRLMQLNDFVNVRNSSSMKLSELQRHRVNNEQRRTITTPSSTSTYRRYDLHKIQSSARATSPRPAWSSALDVNNSNSGSSLCSSSDDIIIKNSNLQPSPLPCGKRRSPLHLFSSSSAFIPSDLHQGIRFADEGTVPQYYAL